MSGASPDGLVYDQGLVEVKCPNSGTHIETLLDAGIEAKYIKQMQWQMASSQRRWCDFVSFDPRLPEPMQLHVTSRRARRRDDRHAGARGWRSSRPKVDAKVASLTKMYPDEGCRMKPLPLTSPERLMCWPPPPMWILLVPRHGAAWRASARSSFAA